MSNMLNIEWLNTPNEECIAAEFKANKWRIQGKQMDQQREILSRYGS